MTASSDGLAGRLDRLESGEAIRALIARYAVGADRRNDPAIMGPLFCPDGVWEAEGFARYEGREAIASGLAQIAARRVLWTLHYMAPPLIELADDGESARCRWTLWELATMRDEGAAGAEDRWLGGAYDAALRRIAEGWRFARVTLDIRLEGRAEPPWAMKKGFQP